MIILRDDVIFPSLRTNMSFFSRTCEIVPKLVTLKIDNSVAHYGSVNKYRAFHNVLRDYKHS
jgi:hypothetical protein